MFGIGVAEFMVILVVALLVFGPDRLPEFARQAGRMVRQLKQFSQQARDDIRTELGPEYAEFELTDLDPRRALRKHILEAWDEDDEAASQSGKQAGKPSGRPSDKVPDRPAQVALAEGELPPYDPDAT